MSTVRIFISYAHRDREFLDRLLTHLAPMQAEGLIEAWTDRAIDAGDHWDDKIAAELARAQVILLLVSADFLASKYVGSKELANALERERRGEAIVVPVILRFADWSSAPFHHLQALPPGGKPVTDWRNRDEAYVEIAKGLRSVVEPLGGQPRTTAQQRDTVTPAPGAGIMQQDRVLDAAMAARIPLGKPSDLAVMVRRTDSPGLKAILSEDDEFTSTPEDVKSKPFQMEFGRDAQGRLKPERLTVQIESPDFDPPSQTDDIIVPPDRDSDVCTFLLRPLFPGELVVKLKVFAQDGRSAIRLMRIISEASDRVITGGRVLASIPITTLAGPGRFEAAASATGTGASSRSGSAAVPAPVAAPPYVPRATAPAPAPAAPAGATDSTPATRSRSRKWAIPAGAAAAMALIGTASLIYLTPRAGVDTNAGIPAARPPEAGARTNPGAGRPDSGLSAESVVRTQYENGMAAANAGNYAVAAHWLQLAAHGQSHDPNLLTRIAEANLKVAAMGEPASVAAGAEAAKKATRIAPESSRAHYALGTALSKQGKPDEAIEELQNAVTLDPSNADARLLLAGTLAQRDPAKAREHIRILENDSSLSPEKRRYLNGLKLADKKNP